MMLERYREARIIVSEEVLFLKLKTRHELVVKYNIIYLT